YRRSLPEISVRRIGLHHESVSRCRERISPRIDIIDNEMSRVIGRSSVRRAVALVHGPQRQMSLLQRLARGGADHGPLDRAFVFGFYGWRRKIVRVWRDRCSGSRATHTPALRLNRRRLQRRKDQDRWQNVSHVYLFIRFWT